MKIRIEIIFILLLGWHFVNVWVLIKASILMLIFVAEVNLIELKIKTRDIVKHLYTEIGKCENNRSLETVIKC